MAATYELKDIMSPNVLYLAHDVSDPAIRRRVLMLKAGGARLSVAGFLRDDNLLKSDADLSLVLLGKTADGRLGQRIRAVLNAWIRLRRLLEGLPKPDLIIARNLEMLVLSKAVSRCFGGVPIVYECLDIHRLLLDRGIKGRLLRATEAHFGKAAVLLMTSSPAFVTHYFKPISKLNLPFLLVENKVLDFGGTSGSTRDARPPGPGQPWRIGWFGAIRCRKSLDLLSSFAISMKGQVEIVIRGRVSPREFPDFEQQIASHPYISFHGAYRNPEDLADIYHQVQFVWAIDFFEEGLNSEWLLPNRLYEGALHGAIPIALKSTQTGQHLQTMGLGLLLDDAEPETLMSCFASLLLSDYQAMSGALAKTDDTSWSINETGCRALVRTLANAAKIASE